MGDVMVLAGWRGLWPLMGPVYPLKQFFMITA